MTSHFIRLPDPIVAVTLVLCACSIVTTNPLLTFVSILFVPFSMKMLWRTGEPPVLFFGVLLQWLTITVKVFYANYLGLVFTEVHQFPLQIEKTFWLSMLGLFFFTVSLHLVIRNLRFQSPATIEQLVKYYDTTKVTYAYLILFFAFPGIIALSRAIPGLQQPLTKVMEMKWSFFYLLFLVVFLKKENRQNFYFIFVAEVILGFTGYFSFFKDFIIIALICYLTLGIRLQPLQYVALVILGAFTFNLAVVWTYVKPEYRAYLSGGEQAQIVTVSQTDALSKILELSDKMTQENFDDAVVDLVNRVSYIDFFSASIAYVPAYLPHQGGAVWSASVQHILLPRIFFPNKPAIDDSQQTTKYTGLAFAGAEQGTSISLGYMAESYVDFGETYMFIPIVALGFLIGFIYKRVLTGSINKLWGYGLVMPLFFSVNINGFASIKIIGGLVMYFLVVLLLNRFVLIHIDRLVRSKR
ncbi:MAG: hypothetical protein H7Z75_13515 [Ferruginibacter sp.]|nr:hypothetical protein [Cytophagales bacterium]